MGLLGDLFDDVVELPGKLVRGACDLSAEVVAQTLCLPLNIVQAAIDAGCKTQEEIEKFAERNMP